MAMYQLLCTKCINVPLWFPGSPNGVEVDVIFHEPGEKDQLFVNAMKQELARMEKGRSSAEAPTIAHGMSVT